MKTKWVHAMILASMAVTPLATLSSGCTARHYDSSGAYVNDKTLTSRIKSELARDPATKAADINVTTFNREVQLSGFVGNEEEKRRAAQITASVPGVVTVHNNLIVRTGR